MSMERLNFVLPEFTRYCWVSNDLRAIWEPKIIRIKNIWKDIEWLSVANGIRSCCLTTVKPTELIAIKNRCSKHGLVVLPLQTISASNYPYSSNVVKFNSGNRSLYRIVIGDYLSAHQFRREWVNQNHKKIGELLGYPTCCCNFFHRIWIEEKFIDTTWHMALRTASSIRTIDCIEVTGPPEVNILWRWVGLRMIPHLPCSFDCSFSIQFGIQLMEMGKELGFESDLSCLSEILSWPIEWSALHGIAEIKTPLLKVSTQTDASTKKYIVRLKSNVIPNLDTSTQHSITEHEYIRWYHTDNGFSSTFTMDKAHKPVVDLVSSMCRRDQIINILDLGCGNGALLKKINETCPNTRPFGIDYDPLKIEHAQILIPKWKDNFIVSDIFDNQIWYHESRFKVVILMPGRLIETANLEQIRRLKRQIENHCDNLVIYAYGNWLIQYENLNGLAKRAGIRLISPCIENRASAGIFRNTDKVIES